MIKDFYFNPTVIVLCLLLLIIAVSMWHAQRNHPHFDAFDLIMENGRVSKIAIAFMLVLAVTTWVIIDLQLKGALTEGYFTMYGTMWVVPLVAKVVFNKTELPANTTFTSTEVKTSTTEKVAT